MGDLIERDFYHPENVVMFRAGLLACREYMARFVEQGGDHSTAASIRANWWPVLGNDPGAPALFDFAELVTETGDPDKPFLCHRPDVNREAAVEAHAFLHHLAAGTLPVYRDDATDQPEQLRGCWPELQRASDAARAILKARAQAEGGE